MDESRITLSERQAMVLLSPRRVVALSILSVGFYFFYWFYITWRHVEAETGEKHYPVWHALTQLVPIYNLFRMHRHLEVIRDLAARSGAESLGPGMGVVLLIVADGLSSASSKVTDPTASLILMALWTATITVLIVMPQRALNAYWRHKFGPEVAEMRLKPAEFLFVALGLLVWLITWSAALLNVE